MNMFITEYDVQVVFRSALTRTAKCLGIKDIDWKSNQELYGEIKSIQSDLEDPLDKFLESYREWYQYHFDRKDKHELTNDERKEVYGLMNNRDATRKDLLDKLQSKGC